MFVDYERALQISGTSPVHSVSNQPFDFRFISRLDTLTGHPWENIYDPPSEIYSSLHFRIGLHDPETKSSWRSLKPGGINNGAIWEGRGLTSSITTGIYFQYRNISASFRPILIYNQNRDFALSRYPPRSIRSGSQFLRSEYSSPFYNIDLPQRFGSEPFYTFDPGPSFLKADFKGFEAGISNQNRWWGPAMQYPIILSNNAPGFRHFFAGTNEPKDIYIGDLETTMFWGKLKESDYFDNQTFNDERFITGFTLSVSPKPTPNLSLGFSRVFYRTLPPEGIPLNNLFIAFDAFTKSSFTSESSPGGNDEFSQMFSLFGRWVFPDSGFEFYGEWARNDHSWNVRDALGEPEHSRAYTAGLQKTLTLNNGNLFAFNAEIVHLETSKTRSLRSDASYYTHGIVHQGYSHRGQNLGSGTGPGSSGQLVKGKYYFKNGMISTWMRRTVYNNDFLFRSNIMLQEPENRGMPKYWLHNFELGMGSSLVLFLHDWETEVGLELMREFNDDFLYKNDKTHLALNIRFRYRLSSLR